MRPFVAPFESRVGIALSVFGALIVSCSDSPDRISQQHRAPADEGADVAGEGNETPSSGGSVLSTGAVPTAGGAGPEVVARNGGGRAGAGRPGGGAPPGAG